MKRTIISGLTAASIILMPVLRADAPGQTDTQVDMQVESITPQTADAVLEVQTSTASLGPQTSGTESESMKETTPPQNLDTDPSSEETYVGQASDEGSKAAKKKMWRSIGLAVAAVAIAVTALILVSKNDGHRKSH
ncbi:MAG: hypothetical protein HYZ48_05735 [Chlamydiales bacterium]|nr:hypothetical protein [Chlamydiales bacterium]